MEKSERQKNFEAIMEVKDIISNLPVIKDNKDIKIKQDDPETISGDIKIEFKKEFDDAAIHSQFIRILKRIEEYEDNHTLKVKILQLLDIIKTLIAGSYINFENFAEFDNTVSIPLFYIPDIIISNILFDDNIEKDGLGKTIEKHLKKCNEDLELNYAMSTENIDGITYYNITENLNSVTKLQLYKDKQAQETSNVSFTMFVNVI